MDLNEMLEALDVVATETMASTEKAALQVADAIMSGRLDNHIALIEGALNSRRKVVGGTGIGFRDLKIGDEIELTDTVRPMYLVGAPGKIVKKNRSRVVINLDTAWLDAHPQAKRRWAGNVTCQPEILKVRK